MQVCPLYKEIVVNGVVHLGIPGQAPSKLASLSHPLLRSLSQLVKLPSQKHPTDFNAMDPRKVFCPHGSVSQKSEILSLSKSPNTFGSITVYSQVFATHDPLSHTS